MVWPSRLLLVVTSLAVIPSWSDGTAVTTTIDMTCPAGVADCAPPKAATAAEITASGANGAQMKCDAGFVLTQDAPVYTAANTAVIKTYCLSKCNIKFHGFVCPPNVQCTKPSYDATSSRLTCSGPSDVMMVQDVAIDNGICIPKTGWRNEVNRQAAIDFTTFETENKPIQVHYYCRASCGVSQIDNSCPKDGSYCSPQDTFSMVGNAPTDASTKYKFKCSNGKKMMINGEPHVEVECDKIGWYASNGTPLLAFNQDPFEKLKAFCYDPCTEFEKCSSHGCVNPTLTSSVLQCSDPKSLLLIDDKMYETATCAETGWEGRTSGFPTVQLLTFNGLPSQKLHPVCHAFCTNMHTTDSSSQEQPTFTNNILTCPTLQVQALGSLYSKVECSRDGWKAGNKILIDFKADPLQKLQVSCQSPPVPPPLPKVGCKAEIGNICETCVEKKPTYSSKKLSCPTAHTLIVATDSEKFYNQVECVDQTGWKSLGPSPVTLIDFNTHPKAVIRAKCVEVCGLDMFAIDCPSELCPNKPSITSTKMTCPATDALMIKDTFYESIQCDNQGWLASPSNTRVIQYSSELKKLNAKCLSKCDAKFIKFPVTNKPIYSKESQSLFCRDGDLEVNGVKDLVDIICDKTKGWSDISGKVVFAFSPTADPTIKVECKPKPPTQAPTTIATSPAPSSSKPGNEEGEDFDADALEDHEHEDPHAGRKWLVIGIIIVVILIGFGLGLFFWCRSERKKTNKMHSDKTSKTDEARTPKKKKSGKKAEKTKSIIQSLRDLKSKSDKKGSEKDVEKGDVAMPNNEMPANASVVDNLTQRMTQTPNANENNVVNV